MWSAKINGSTAKYAGLSEVNPVVTPIAFEKCSDNVNPIFLKFAQFFA